MPLAAIRAGGAALATPSHIAALAALALAAGPALAHDPSAETANDHGKLATSDATPVGAGVLELALVWQPSWIRGAHGAAGATGPAWVRPFGLGLVRGVTEDLDVGVSLAWTSAAQADPGAPSRRGEGLSDVLVTARWRFACDRELDLAVVAGLVIPAGLKETSTHLGFTQGFWSGQLALVASFDEGPFTGNLEAGAALPIGSPASPDLAAAFANAGFGVQVVGWLQPTLEANWMMAFEDTGRGVETLAATAGVVLTLPDGYGLTAGLQRVVWGRRAVTATSALLAVKRAF